MISERIQTNKIHCTIALAFCLTALFKILSMRDLSNDSLVNSIGCFSEDSGLIPSSHNGGSQLTVSTVPGNLMLSYGICRYQVCIWCRIFSSKDYFTGIWIESTINTKLWKYRWQAEWSIQGNIVGHNIRKETVIKRTVVRNCSAREETPQKQFQKRPCWKPKNASLPKGSLWLNDYSREDAPGCLVGPSGLLTTYSPPHISLQLLL